MRLKRLGELGALEAIKGALRPPSDEVVVGIGDDAAAVGFSGASGLLLVTADMLVEGVHFDLGHTSWLDLGYKAVAVNISDIAAMGGRPLYYLVSLALDGEVTQRELLSLYEGMEQAGEEFGVSAIGGDTCASPGQDGPAVISVTLIGRAGPNGAVTRGGARPGDEIYVTGALGDSGAGLDILKGAGKLEAGADRLKTVADKLQAGPGKLKAGAGIGVSELEYLAGRHLRPSPRVAVGQRLADAKAATSMIDISDGLSADLWHILDNSCAGAEIDAASLPISDELAAYAGGRKGALKYALDCGEDYELLFTAKEADVGAALDAAETVGVRVTRIGRVTGGTDAFLIGEDGIKRVMTKGGYEHFR